MTHSLIGGSAQPLVETLACGGKLSLASDVRCRLPRLWRSCARPSADDAERFYPRRRRRQGRVKADRERKRELVRWASRRYSRRSTSMVAFRKVLMKKRWYPAVASLVVIGCSNDFSILYGPCTACSLETGGAPVHYAAGGKGSGGAPVTLGPTGGRTSWGSIDSSPASGGSSRDAGGIKENDAATDGSIDDGVPPGTN